MDDDQGRIALDDSDPQKPASCVGTHEHREAVIQVEDSNRVGESVQHVLVVESVPSDAGRDVRPIARCAKLVCRGGGDKGLRRTAASRLTILERGTRCPGGDRSCRARTVAAAGKLGAVPTVDSRY